MRPEWWVVAEEGIDPAEIKHDPVDPDIGVGVDRLVMRLLREPAGAVEKRWHGLAVDRQDRAGGDLEVLVADRRPAQITLDGRSP